MSPPCAATMLVLLLSATLGCGACTRVAGPPATNTESHLPLPPTEPPNVLILPAKSGAPTTLVVLLHGYGADAAGFHDIARAFAPGFPEAEFLTPDGFEPSELGGDGHQWFGLAGVSEANRAARIRDAATRVSAWIDRQLDARRLGHDRLVVIGFSQGSMIAAWLAVHRRPSPAAVVMFSGRVSEDEKPVARSVATPVFMAHGTDDGRIPVMELESGAVRLEAWGAQVTTRVYAGLGHSIDGREIGDATAFLKTALAPK